MFFNFQFSRVESTRELHAVGGGEESARVFALRYCKQFLDVGQVF